MMAACDLRVTDLKQFACCPRIPFYQHIMDLRVKQTYKMEQGKTAQAAVEALEKRRKLREYGLAEGHRHFGLWLSSGKLNLSGKLDLLIETDSACYPVDFKYTTGRPHRNHVFQLAGYALLVSECFVKPVPAGFIYQMTDDVVMSEPLFAEARDALSTLQ
jgi:CRISPR-associated exonuclease Cas4